MSDFRVGDIVRVVDADEFIQSFGNKVRDRDAIVDWVGPDVHGQFKGYAKVTFQKRNGRGKEFSERMREQDLCLKEQA